MSSGAPRASLEALARRARYDALAAAARDMGAGVVALAHHRNDQAETLLLQLLRGSGPHGLAAMPALREDADGLAWWRPLLGVPRARIDAYAIDRNLRWCDDESNADHRHARNAVRHSVLPALLQIAPNADATLARAAAHQADAARLLDELARQDAQGALDGEFAAARSVRHAVRRTARATCCAGTCATRDCLLHRPRVSPRCSTSCAARAATR